MLYIHVWEQRSLNIFISSKSTLQSRKTSEDFEIYLEHGFQSFRCHGPPNIISFVQVTPVHKCIRNLYILMFEDPIYTVKISINV